MGSSAAINVIELFIPGSMFIEGESVAELFKCHVFLNSLTLH